jgi:hypothetical protein
LFFYKIEEVFDGIGETVAGGSIIEDLFNNIKVRSRVEVLLGYQDLSDMARVFVIEPSRLYNNSNRLLNMMQPKHICPDFPGNFE